MLLSIPEKKAKYLNSTYLSVEIQLDEIPKGDVIDLHPVDTEPNVSLGPPYFDVMPLVVVQQTSRPCRRISGLLSSRACKMSTIKSIINDNLNQIVLLVNYNNKNIS